MVSGIVSIEDIIDDVKKNICSLNHRFRDDLPQSLDKGADRLARELEFAQNNYQGMISKAN